MDETIFKSGVSTWAYDPTRGLIYVADDNSGTIATWSLAADRVISTTQIGHPVDTLAITNDGRFLVAGESNAVSMGDLGGVDAVDRMDLGSGRVERFTFPTVFREGGVSHLAITENNQVLISDWAATTSGDYPLHSFDAEAANPTFSALPVLPAAQTGSFLFTSPDHALVLVTEANASGAPLDLYDSRLGQVLARLPALGAVVPADFNRGVADVTDVATAGVSFVTSSGLVAVSPGEGSVYVLDTQLHLLKDLTPLFPRDPSSHFTESIISVKFTGDARELFVWDQTTAKISVIDTQTWQRVATLDAPTGHDDNPPDFQQWGLMDFVNQGRSLLVDDQHALQIIDLTSRLHINLSGTLGNDIENGGVGTDSLSGGGGNDTITGGLDGADILDGGAGDDSIASQAGAAHLLGGDGADTLNAGYNAAEVSGGAGNDFLELTGENSLDVLRLTRMDGGDGDDRFLVYAYSNQPLTIDGGTGQNSLVMHYFGLGTEPIVVHLNGDASAGAWIGTGLQTVTVLNHLANVVGGDAAETITAPGVIAGGGGDDVLVGSNPEVQDSVYTTMTLSGADTINGGLGNDTVNGLSGQNYLRGDEGDDSISGGSGFDDANGNMGNDTISTGAGDDYSVGGKDNDVLFGDAGNDIVWGNLGNDTCDGGDGNDQCRGGQGDDSVSGGAGDDFISGDRGNDTVAGGAGADLFHTSQDAGVDKVLDFNLAEGDRVQLDPGTTFTLNQVGADTVIDMGAGNQMILVGVQLSTLTPGWIFGA